MQYRGETLLGKFDDVVNQFPDQVALLFNEQSTSYRQLHEGSLRLAYYLSQNNDIKPGQRIGLMLEPSPLLISAIFAILRLGCCYVPIHVEYPAQRVDSMVNSAGLALILTSEQPLIERLDIAKPLPDLDSLAVVDEKRLAQYQRNIGEHSECYLIYTSGSTGEPKGVPITNQNLIERFCSTHSFFDFNENDVWMLFHSPVFDFSVWEIFASIMFGAKLVIVDESVRRSPWMVVDMINRYGITVLCQTPSYFAQLLMAMKRIEADEPHQLRYIIFGGEAINLTTVGQWFEYNNCSEKPQLVNMYGITETTIHVTHKVLTPLDCQRGVNNIGKPLAGTYIRLLDEDLNDIKAGEKGEIAVYGYGVSNGYINAPQQNKEKFVYLPVDQEQILHYLSGDMGRLLDDENYEYCGRKDRQVKVGGYRIELNEIENACNHHPDVINSHVFVMKVANTSQLSLFYQCVVGKQLSPQQMTEHLSSLLPHYIIPPFIESIDSLPMTVNGKVDSVKLQQLRTIQ